MTPSYRWYHRLAAWLHDLIANTLADLATPYWIYLAERDLDEEWEAAQWNDDPVTNPICPDCERPEGSCVCTDGWDDWGGDELWDGPGLEDRP